MLRGSALLAIPILALACGGHDDSASSDGGIDANAVDTAFDSNRAEREFSCPSTAAETKTQGCHFGGTCSYPCPPGNPNKQTFSCEGGMWKPTSYCEPPAATNTVGVACTTHAECDRTGEGTHYCTLGAFAGDSIYPTPVCIASDCTPGGPLTTCDGERGLCFDTGATGICLPRCTFGNDGSPAKGCLGRNMCWPAARADAATWMGFCSGGCTKDEDCPTGNRCDPDRLVCVKTVAPSTKAVGDACDSTDASMRGVCYCIFNRTTLLGYCSKMCRVGETSCPAGYACDPMIPDGDPAKIPVGIGGRCLKACAVDSDCVNSKCEQHAGMSTKTCTVDRLP